MASVVSSWIRILCPRCRGLRVFRVGPNWVLACEECGLERPLKPGSVYAAGTQPR